MSVNQPRRVAALLAGVCISLPVLALAAGKSTLVKVDDAWIRPAVEGQMATGGFMRLTAKRNLTLVGFVSPVARSSELHEMAMDGDVMRMRPVPSIELPAGKTVSLQTGPGHQHLMLMDLRQPLKVGDEVRVTLKLRTPDGKALTQTVKVPVKSAP
jgi:copper(I)-binding protein